MREIAVAELFAGVGGFRLGLEGNPRKNENTGFKVLFSNQWEPPGGGKQWASQIYRERFGLEGHTNEDIHDIAYNIGDIKNTIRNRIPKHDLLVGGFPCQDYSVARTISGELGIKGEKGKLWVPIKQIIKDIRPRPKIVLLENVPRILNSPANARGRNFAIIVNDLIKMGYNVEWKVINAAEYGMPQKRRRVFIIAYRGSWCGQNFSVNGSKRYGALIKTRKKISDWMVGSKDSENELGPFAQSFPSTGKLPNEPELLPDINYSFNQKSPFKNTGYAYLSGSGSKQNPYIGKMWTIDTKAKYEGEYRLLGDEISKKYDKKYIIDNSRIDEWIYVKGSKNEFRLRKGDRENVDDSLLRRYDSCMNAPHKNRREMWMNKIWRKKFKNAVGLNSFYRYDEGNMGFDKLDKAARTIVTAEIGKSPSRMRHIFRNLDEPGTYRRLMPIETEKLNMFPENWTKIENISDSTRGFIMGNALVVGIIEKLRNPIRDLINKRD